MSAQDFESQVNNMPLVLNFEANFKTLYNEKYDETLANLEKLLIIYS